MTNRLPLPLAALLLAMSALLGACASGGPASEYSYLLPAASEPAASDQLPRVRVDVAGYLDQAGVVVETAPTSVRNRCRASCGAPCATTWRPPARPPRAASASA